MGPASSGNAAEVVLLGESIESVCVGCAIAVSLVSLCDLFTRLRELHTPYNTHGTKVIVLEINVRLRRPARRVSEDNVLSTLR